MSVERTRTYNAMKSIFINHPNFAWALEEIRDLIDLSPTSDAPCIHVSGPSGVGKTTLKDRLKAEYPPVPDGAVVKLRGNLTMVADRHQLLIVDMPAEPTVKSLARAMLKAYGDDEWHKGDEYSLGDRVDRFIAASQTNAVLIDEAQRAIDRQGTVVSDKLLDWLKARHAENPVGFILLGLGRLRYLFEADRQIERRWDSEIRLEPYRWRLSDGSDDLDGQANFLGLLAKFRDLSPVPFRVDIEDDEVAFRFFYISQGLIGGIKKLLLRAVRLSARSQLGEPSLDLKLLEGACDKAFRLRQNAMVNPFHSGFEQRMPPELDDDYQLPIPKKIRQTKRRLSKAVELQLTR
jgi:hypothetical protein